MLTHNCLGKSLPAVRTPASSSVIFSAAFSPGPEQPLIDQETLPACLIA